MKIYKKIMDSFSLLSKDLNCLKLIVEKKVARKKLPEKPEKIPKFFGYQFQMGISKKEKNDEFQIKVCIIIIMKK